MPDFLDPLYPRLWISEIIDHNLGDRRIFIGPHEEEAKAHGWGENGKTRILQVHQLSIPCLYEGRMQMVLNPPIVVEYKDLSDEQLQKVLELRKAARDQKNFPVSDAIRDVLKICGVLVEDGPEGQRYKRL